jgi:heme/copper-type cytochrome/quinol oxidase subunit 2
MDSISVLVLCVVGVTLLVAGSLLRSHASSRSARQDPRRIRRREEGRIGWIVLWLLGIPIPVLILLFLLRGCT